MKPLLPIDPTYHFETKSPIFGSNPDCSENNNLLWPMYSSLYEESRNSQSKKEGEWMLSTGKKNYVCLSACGINIIYRVQERPSSEGEKDQSSWCHFTPNWKCKLPPAPWPRGSAETCANDLIIWNKILKRFYSSAEFVTVKSSEVVDEFHTRWRQVCTFTRCTIVL